MISQYRQTGDDEIIEEIVDLCQELNGYLELTAKHAAIYLYVSKQWIRLDDGPKQSGE